MKKEQIKLNRWKEWKEELVKNDKKISFSVLFLILALLINYASGIYASSITGTPSADIILDHIGPYDLSFVYIWLYLAVSSLFILYPIFCKPKKISSTIAIVSLFILVRSIFISLTHLELPAGAINPAFPWIFKYLSFKNDLFFSGHAGLPFLGFLIFKENKKLRYFMLASSIILAITVLLMHAHYSIDVFAAYFITYGIYKIGERIFKL